MRCVFGLIALLLSACSQVGGDVTRASSDRFTTTLAAVQPVAEALCAQRHTAQHCHFEIILDPRTDLPPNAFQSLDAAGRPTLTFTKSMIAQTRNTDELAFIIAHEAAHHIESHLARQMRRADGGAVSHDMLVMAIAAADGNRIDAARFGLLPAGDSTALRGFELEADALGAHIIARAGFDLARAVTLFDRMIEPAQTAWSTHPSNAARRTAILLALGEMNQQDLHHLAP